jgi:hypothetical protein
MGIYLKYIKIFSILIIFNILLFHNIPKISFYFMGFKKYEKINNLDIVH